MMLKSSLLVCFVLASLCAWAAQPQVYPLPPLPPSPTNHPRIHHRSTNGLFKVKCAECGAVTTSAAKSINRYGTRRSDDGNGVWIMRAATFACTNCARDFTVQLPEVLKQQPKLLAVLSDPDEPPNVDTNTYVVLNLMSATNAAGPWEIYPSSASLIFTNPVGNMFFKMSIEDP